MPAEFHANFTLQTCSADVWRPLIRWVSRADLRIDSRELWAMFRKPQPLQLVQKVRQYTSNLYGSTLPICIAVLSWLLSFEERETLQYASHLYGSTPPICTAVRPPFVRQYFWKNTGGWGHQNVSEIGPSKTWGGDLEGAGRKSCRLQTTSGRAVSAALVSCTCRNLNLITPGCLFH